MSEQVKEFLSIGNKADLDKKMKEKPEELKKVLEWVQDHMNTINDDDTITPAERNKAREVLVKLRQLDLDEKQSIEAVATGTKANLADLIHDVELFSAYEAENVTDGSTNLDGDKKKWVLGKFDAVAKELNISRSKAMIMAQRWWDISQGNTAALGGRYDLAIGPKVIGASEDPKKYIDIYQKWLKDGNSTGSGGNNDSQQTQAPGEREESGEKPEWLSKIDIASFWGEEKWKQNMIDQKLIDQDGNPIGYFASLIALDGKFFTAPISMNDIATMNGHHDKNLIFSSGEFETGAREATGDNEQDDIVTMIDGRAVALDDNPGKMPTFEVDGTYWAEDYRFDSFATFIQFLKQDWEPDDGAKNADKLAEVVLEKYAKRLAGGKDGPEAKFLKEKWYFDDNEWDLDNQLNSLMSLPDEAWGDYKLSLGDVERFYDATSTDITDTESGDFFTSEWDAIHYLSQFKWEPGKDWKPGTIINTNNQDKYENVADLMQKIKKAENTIPENYSLKEVKDFSKMKPADIKKALETQAVVFKDRMPISGLQYEVSDDKKITISRNDTGNTVNITREGNSFSLTVNNKKYTYTSFEQAVAMANLINFADKYLSSENNYNLEAAGGKTEPFQEYGTNGIEFVRSTSIFSPTSWTNGDFLDDGDHGATYYAANIEGGTKAVKAVLNSFFKQKKSQSLEW